MAILTCIDRSIATHFGNSNTGSQHAAFQTLWSCAMSLHVDAMTYQHADIDLPRATIQTTVCPSRKSRFHGRNKFRDFGPNPRFSEKSAISRVFLLYSALLLTFFCTFHAVYSAFYDPARRLFPQYANIDSNDTTNFVIWPKSAIFCQ